MSPLDHAELVALVERMPAFPKSVQRVVQLTSNIDVSAKEIVQVIECDPVLTVKILKVINSAFYGLSQKINSVQRAVVHIGLNTVKNLAMSVAAMGMLNTSNKANFSANAFLLHALTTAAISRKLAERAGLSQQECSDCFVAGLIHDFGKVVFAEFMPEQFKLALTKSREDNVSLHLTELEFIGMNHVEAGTLLAEKWGLSELLIDAIRHHHGQPVDAFGECLFAANQISKQLHFGNGGNPVVEPFPEAIVNRFGMPLEALIESLGNLGTVVKDAELFISH
ncbi:HDOD domain-containing protein [Methylomicrobium sp. Wu6]|uniref:HDOD domain-containing protein n=1 Tax=Methylomicrobium sp. Wu6 TaxID=3107928 RepID=UPI002DD6B551|nr:HDOD domain-containing protein [Methylomicrobium sp. Wu6]MEC4748821.1 HDOD domain-containing protein [Methylomicrobium sp. Wu6]